jgi:hypothetical protein
MPRASELPDDDLQFDPSSPYDFVSHLCPLPPLVNNHMCLLFVRHTTYDAVINMLDTWP